MTIFEMKEVTYRVPYKNEAASKGRKQIVAVDHLAINEGEMLGIIGPNGAGKSSLIKLMALLESPTSGEIYYRGNKIYPGQLSLNIRRQMATVFQHSYLLKMSVYDNVAIGLKFRKVNKKERDERIRHWLDVFRISHLAKQHAYTLSGGEAQRVNLARSLVLQPDLLFLDEPFAGLDFPTKRALAEDLTHVLKNTNTTTIFVSHDLIEINIMTEKLAVMMAGQVVQKGKTLDVIQHPNHSAAPFINEWRSVLAPLDMKRD